jgi:hypothetical protein
VKEADLEREFGRFGPIERVCPCTPMSCDSTITNMFVDYSCQRHYYIREEKEASPRLCFHCVRAREGHERYRIHADLLGTDPIPSLNLAVRYLANTSVPHFQLPTKKQMAFGLKTAESW